VKKWFAILLPLALFATARPIRAQELASKFEVYDGYYYARFNVNVSATSGTPSETFNGNGVGGQLEYNATKWLGRVGDLAGYGATSTTNGQLVGGAFTHLFGPRVNLRRGRFMPFVHTLFGGIRTTDGIASRGRKTILR
jgi:hypothetical protein